MDLSKHCETIFNSLRDGILVIDTNGCIIAANSAAEKLSGYTAEELKQKDCRILNCAGCKIWAEGPGPKWCKLFQVGTSRDKKCLLTTKDGKTVHIAKTATVLKDSAGKIIGAVETLTDISQIVRQQQEIQHLHRNCCLNDGFHGILGKSPVMLRMFELIDNVAQSDAPVLILGESGTGKELVANAIHSAGLRKDKPFVKVNCAALNENLLESELFGHVKGAFTGAGRNRIGRFEAAHKGTIFLDEIGDLPQSTQIKLLRVLQEKRLERVGDHTPIPIDVRILTATNRNIESLVKAGKFREDLYFRINVFPLTCPQLRDRKNDIPIIAQYYLKRNTFNSGKKILGISPEAMKKLTAYSWPGNVRELGNAIEYAFVLCPNGSIGVNHLPAEIIKDTNHINSPLHYDEKAQLEKETLIETLQKTYWNQTEAARIMGVSRVTVWKRIKKYGMMKN